MIEKCHERAKEVIRICSTKHGLFASGGIDGYDAIWARDSMISMIGASASKEKPFKNVFKQSIITLAKNQSPAGQIPNAVDRFSSRKGHVDFASIDSSLWYIIGHHTYKKRYNDGSLLKKYKKTTDNALLWLRCQDTGEKNMLTQQPTSDWQDAFPHKYGYTINTQALYYHVLRVVKDNSAKKLKFMANENKDTRLWDKNFYLPYRWKNHNKYLEVGNWFDSLGNLMAIIFNLAGKSRSEKILDYIDKNNVNRPYPVKAIYPPINKNSKYWQDYYLDSDAGVPYQYLNAGIWTYIGAFYILALIKTNKIKKASEEIKLLAKANLDGDFAEWIHPKTREHFGKLQAWNAGMYILAYESLKKKKVLL